VFRSLLLSEGAKVWLVTGRVIPEQSTGVKDLSRCGIRSGDRPTGPLDHDGHGTSGGKASRMFGSGATTFSGPGGG